MGRPPDAREEYCTRLGIGAEGGGEPGETHGMPAWGEVVGARTPGRGTGLSLKRRCRALNAQCSAIVSSRPRRRQRRKCRSCSTAAHDKVRSHRRRRAASRGQRAPANRKYAALQPAHRTVLRRRAAAASAYRSRSAPAPLHSLREI